MEKYTSLNREEIGWERRNSSLATELMNVGGDEDGDVVAVLEKSSVSTVSSSLEKEIFLGHFV